MEVLTKKNTALFIFVISLFFCAYSTLTIVAPKVYTSPDENSNLFFINLYASTGKLFIKEPLNELSSNYLHPRNAIAVDGKVMPSGFPGIDIIYGSIGAIAPQMILYIAPVFALLGGFYLYIITSCLYDKRTGLLAMLLLFILPPYWFWANMGLFNNMGASVFLIGTVAFTFQALKTQKLAYYILIGIMLAVNNFFRFTDIIYCLPLFYVLLVFRKQIQYRYIPAIIFSYLLVISPLFITNKQLFGSIFSFGYTAVETTNAKENLPLIVSVFKKILFFLLPSGFHPERIIFNTYTYIVSFIPLFFIFTFIGITNYINNKSSFARSYIVYFALLTVVILVYYGSGVYWGLNGFTFDASYIRYFLPIYIFSIPIAAKLILTFHRRISILFLSLIVIISIISVHTIKSGILDMNLRRFSSETQKKGLLSIIPNDAIVVTTYSDKIIFPDRKVLFYGPIYNQVLQSDKIFTYEKLNKILTDLKEKKQNVYILDDRADLNLQKINRLLNTANYRLATVNKDMNIYKLN